MNKKLIFFIAAIGFVFGQTKAEAQLTVLEQFEYADGASLSGLNGGMGFASGWDVNNGSGPELTVDASGSLAVGDLETSGGFISRDNRTNITTVSRTLDAASVSALTGDGTTLWGSFVYQDGNGNGFLPDSSLTLASVPAAVANNHSLSSAGVGVGIAIEELGRESNGIFYDNNEIRTNGSSTLPVDFDNFAGADPTTGVSVVGAVTTTLFVFSVEWNPDGTPDVLTFYNVTDPTAALPAAFSTTTFDYTSAEQASLNTLNIVEAQTGEFDEIRLGLSLADVLPTSTDCLLGDVNTSGAVDFADIAPFIGILSASGFQCEADVNVDGMVDFNDIAPFISILAGA